MGAYLPFQGAFAISFFVSLHAVDAVAQARTQVQPPTQSSRPVPQDFTSDLVGANVVTEI